MGIFNKRNKKSNIAINEESMSLVLSNNPSNFIILTKYSTLDQYRDMIDFLTAANYTKLTIITSNIAESIEQETDFVIKPLKEVSYINYTIISGHIREYVKLFKYINLANGILNTILPDFYNNIESKYFKDLIDNNVLDESDFIEPPIKYLSKKEINISNKYKIIIDDASTILSKIPNIFTMSDLIKIITIQIYDSSNIIINTSLYKFIEYCANNDNDYTKLYNLLVSNSDILSIFKSDTSL